MTVPDHLQLALSQRSPAVAAELERVPQSAAFEPELLRSAWAYAARSKAPRTRELYRRAFKAFDAWCLERAVSALPADPKTVALYLTARADQGRKVSTIELDLSAIAEGHRLAGFPSPRGSAAVSEILKGIRQTKGVATLQKQAADAHVIRAMLAHLPSSSPLGQLRDRALLLVGFSGAFRRSELVGIRLEHLQFVDDGLTIALPRSKTDQLGRGTKVAIPYARQAPVCPVRAVSAWLEGLRARLEELQLPPLTLDDPLFWHVDRHGRPLEIAQSNNVAAGELLGLDPHQEAAQTTRRALTGQGVAVIVKRAAAAAGYDRQNFSGHSLRAGLATAAAAARRPLLDIQRQTRHRSLEQLRQYIREGAMFLDNASADLL